MKHYLQLSIKDRVTQQRRLRSVSTPWAMALLILVGIGLRLWLISVSNLDPRYSNADDGDYYHRALRLAVTGQYIDDYYLIRPPLHVFFFAIWIRLALVIGQPQLGVLFVQLAQIASAVLATVIGFDLARRLFRSQRAGWIMAIFLACWFPFVELPSVLLSELLYVFLFLLHFWLLLRFDQSERRRDLALAGLALGAAALTRSPALYSLAFVGLWLLLRRPAGPTNLVGARRWHIVARQTLLVSATCLAVVSPWTLRNYLVYQRFIPIDTLGPINLWLDLDGMRRRAENSQALWNLPQADRQAYATEQLRKLLAEDPLRPFRGMWPAFRHIWKAQYVEDLFVKQSFFGRSLREPAPLGLAGDLLWFGLTLAGVAGLASRPCEGLHHRLFVLVWLAYSTFTVLIFHVEPRYLLPFWVLLALYGAGMIASIGRPTSTDQSSEPAGRRWIMAQLAAALAFLVLVVTYRDYPAIIARGLAREQAIVAGERAYNAGNYQGAERDFRAALAAQPDFVDGQVLLALALAGQGRQAEAAGVLTPGGSRQSELVGGALARDMGDNETAQATIKRIEATAGEDVQHWALEWLRPPATSRIQIGDNLDIGYIAGFSPSEQGPAGSYRWLESSGRIVLPLPAPLKAGDRLALRLTGGIADQTPLEVRINGGAPQQLPVARGQWRDYYLPVPQHAQGQRSISIELRAPTFVPARLDPASNDSRSLSLMVSAVRVLAQ